MLNNSNLMSSTMGTVQVGTLFGTDVQSLWTCKIDDVQRPGTYWTEDRCKEYIMSICSGLAPTPIVFVARTATSPRSIIDGQHRVRAIRRFIDGEICIGKCVSDRYQSVAGVPFPEWDELHKRSFYREQLIVTLFLPSPDATLSDEQWWNERALLFKNLNSSRPVSRADIGRLECKRADEPFNKALENIIYFDDPGGDYVFKPDKGSRCAFQTLTLCGYSYILGEVSEVYPNTQSESHKPIAIKKAVDIKSTIYSVLGQKELEDRIGKMHDALLSSRHTKPMPRSSQITAMFEIRHAIIALSGLFNVKHAGIDEITSALQDKADECLRNARNVSDAYRVVNTYRSYLSELKRIYSRGKKITAPDMLRAAMGLKTKV